MSAYSQPPGWRNLRLGIFFLISTALLVGFLFVVGTNQHLFQRHYNLEVYLSNAQGISKGSAVTLSGLEVGKVADIRFAQLDTSRALEFTLTIERDQHERITGSSVAIIRTVGVLGDKFIDISLGNPGETPLPGGSVLPVRGEIDWTVTFARATGAIDDLTRFLKNAAATLDSLNRGQGTLAVLLQDPETAARVRSTVDDLSVVARGLRSGNGAAGRLLADPATGRELEGILSRLDRITAQVDSGHGPVGRLLSDRDLGDRLESVITGTDSLVAAIRTGGTTGRLVEDEHLYDNLTTALGELRALLEDMRNNPRKYFKVSVF